MPSLEATGKSAAGVVEGAETRPADVCNSTDGKCAGSVEGESEDGTPPLVRRRCAGMPGMAIIVICPGWLRIRIIDVGVDTDLGGDRPAEEVTDPEEAHLTVDPSLPVDPFEGTLTVCGFAGCVSGTCGVGAELVGESCDVTTAEAGLAAGGRKAKPSLSWIPPPSLAEASSGPLETSIDACITWSPSLRRLPAACLWWLIAGEDAQEDTSKRCKR